MPPHKNARKEPTNHWERYVHWLCNKTVHHPLLGFFATLAVALALTFIGFVAYPIMIDATQNSFVPRASSIGRLEETRVVAEEVTAFNPYRDVDDITGVVVPQQTSYAYSLTLLFDAGDANILSANRILMVRNVEQAITSFVDSTGTSFSDLCLRSRESGECVNLESLSPYFYASPITGCPGVYNPDGESTSISQDIDTVLLSLIDEDLAGVFCFTDASNCTANCIEPTPSFPDFAVGVDFGYPDDNSTLEPVLESGVTRTYVAFGVPLDGYDSISDRYDEQISKIETFVREVAKRINDFDGDQGVGISKLAEVINREYFDSLVYGDVALVAASVAVVFLYMVFHLQTVFVASMGMLHVLLSFPIAYLFTQAAMDFGGMSVLNLMALFIILGIGADDIFIFVDAWKQSEHEVPDRNGVYHRNAATREEESQEDNLQWIEDRLVWSYHRSSSAMLITSLTTGAAFVMNLTSSIPAIQIFGGFTGFMILFNYILVITYFPFAVITFHRYLRFFRWPCFSWPCFTPCCKPKNSTVLEKPQAPQNEDSDALAGIENYRLMERFFYNTYADFVYTKRWYIIVFFIALFAVGVGFATQLKPATEPTRWLPDSDPFQKAFDLLNYGFARSAYIPQISIIYGLLPIDQSHSNKYNSADVGRTRFDPNFDPTSPDFQENFIAICERVRVNGHSVLNGEVLCPLEDFRDYVVNELEMTFPVPEDEFLPLLANFTEYWEVSNGPAPDVSGSTPQTEQTPETRDNRAKEPSSVFQAIRFRTDTDDLQLAYLQIVANTTLGVFNTGSDIDPVYDSWWAMVRSENGRDENIMSTLNNGIQTANLYLDLEIENSLLQAALNGIFGSWAIAVFIIAIMTKDLILTFMASTAILGVVGTLIGFIVMIGWDLSLIESLCLTILVGLSVDYAIHLAHAYQESHATTRRTRVRHALVVMGISVLSASITTFLSSFVLFFSYIIFFFKFGLFIAFTIFFSTLWSFGFFMALTAVFGSLTKVNHFAKIWAFVTCRKMPERDEDASYANNAKMNGNGNGKELGVLPQTQTQAKELSSPVEPAETGNVDVVVL